MLSYLGGSGMWDLYNIQQICYEFTRDMFGFWKSQRFLIEDIMCGIEDGIKKLSNTMKEEIW